MNMHKILFNIVIIHATRGSIRSATRIIQLREQTEISGSEHFAADTRKRMNVCTFRKTFWIRTIATDSALFMTQAIK